MKVTDKLDLSINIFDLRITNCENRLNELESIVKKLIKELNVMVNDINEVLLLKNKHKENK